MIEPTTKNSHAIVATMLRLGFSPWEYPTEVAWQQVADAYNNQHPNDQLSAEAIRARYRRIDSWLERNGYAFDEYAESVLYNSGLLEEWTEKMGNLETEPTEEPVPAKAVDSVKSPEDLLAAAGLNPLFYEVASGKVSNWGNGGSDNWAVSANFKRREVPDQEVLDYIVKAVNGVDAPPYSLDAPQNTTGEGLLAVVSIYDAHLEKVELGGNFERKVLDYHKALLTLAGRIQSPAQFVVPIGNDFGNFDNIQGNTTKGTPQENSVNWQTGVDIRVKLVLWTAEVLSEIAPVHLVFVPGNHDRMTTYFLGKVLEARYEDDLYITVDNSHLPRKYYLWNNVGLMFTHGSDEKLSDLPMLFATEGNAVFGAAKYREIHTGDKHGRQLTEKFGVVTRILPSLSGPDNWHVEKGFVGQNRGAMALLYTENSIDSELFCYV